MDCTYLYEGKWYTEDQLKGIYNQLGGGKTIPSKASAGTMKKIREFLDRIGIETQSLAKITYNGQTLGVNGIADPLRGLIQVVQGKEDIALPEEAMHMAVELIEQKDPKLFKEMMDRIGRYDLFDQVMLEYQNNSFYQTKEGKADVRKIKKETVGKVLAQTVINKNQDSNEKPELLNQTRTWWEKIIDFLKRLFLRAEFNPFEEAAAQVLEGKLEGAITSSETPFASRNPNAVNATLKLISSLRDPRAAKWFKSLDKITFLNKLQQDLQAPKAQVDMLKKWIQGKEFDSIGDIIAGVLSELSYTVEVNMSMGSGRQENEIGIDPMEDFLGEERPKLDQPTEYYSNLTVPGGINYREIEIKTPDIIPSIKGHAQFATNQGIGWFRSDDQIIGGEVRKVPVEFRDTLPDESPTNLHQMIGGNPTKTRRILEIQSDLFQKSRPRWDEKLQGWTVHNITYSTKEGAEAASKNLATFPKSRFESITREEYNSIPMRKTEVELATGTGYNSVVHEDDVYYYMKTDYDSYGRILKSEIGKPNPANEFLQLLSSENNWVTFFVKAIIQDSAKKEYEKIVFPGGSTANKIEGQTTVEEFIAIKQKRLEEIKDLQDVPQGKKVTWSMIPHDRSGKIGKFDTKEEAEMALLESTNPTIIANRDKISIEAVEETIPAKKYSIERERLNAEIKDAEEGKTKFAAIAKFYENTVQNILKKQGYNPKEITDEHGNKWFEIDIKPNRDLGEFYFQVSGPQDLAQKITEKDANITKRGEEYEINGNKIRKSVQQQILDFYKKRLGAANADKALRGFRQETENKVQVDIKDIFNRYIDDDHKVRITPLPQTNPSAVDPQDNSFYLTIEGHLKERIDSYEPGTQFIHSVNLYDGLNTAGHADLIAITPQGMVDVLQFKVPQLSQVASDVPVYRQEAYNLEIEALRKILQVGYGIPRSNFRQTRAIPIKAEYERVAPGISDLKLSKLTIGNVNVTLIKDDLLLPISSESETSENEKFDEYIMRLRALAQKLASERVSPDKRQERSQRVAELIGAIRKLQIKKDGSGILSSAKAIIKRSKERIISLRDKISNTDPNVATIEELNKISEEVLSDKDQIEIYKDLYSIYKSIFTDGTVDSEDMIKEARAISDDANDLINDYWETSVQFRTKKLAAKVGIKDEFTPEKKLTWYRRMIRSLSQSSIKAGAILWRLVQRINGKFKLEFLDRLDELQSIERDVSEWMKGKSVQDLYKKIFQYDSQGRWNGRVIQKIDRKFYEDLKKAQENKDEKWIKENIDIDKYKEWFKDRHQKRIDNAKTARLVADDAENARLVQQGLQDFVDTFNIDFKKGVGTYNWALKNYPKEDKWKSAEYQELENIELVVDNKKVKPLLRLYEYYRDRLEESWDLGMLNEHSGWSWFPNVRRELLEKLSTAPAGGKLKSFFGSIRIEAEDQTFGKIDPITGKPIDEIHANFVSDLGEWVQAADGNYFLDYSEKSMDIFKVLALWDSEIIKYKLRSESEAIARLVYYTESNRKAYESTAMGNLKKTPEGKPIPISNEVNSAYIKEHIDAVYYGKASSDEFDVAFNIPYKSIVERINKMFGSQILTVPEEENIRISGIKAIEVMNRYFVTKTLGLNVMTSIAQLFGGKMNTAINQGLYFNKKDMLEAEFKYVSGKFYMNEEDKKLAGLISYIHPFAEDRTSQMIRKLSVSKMVEYLSSDHLFYLQRGSDNWVNTIIALGMIKNTMVADGKLVNIRDFARKELGHANKYSGTYAEAKEFDKKLEQRVAELQKSPQSLINYAQVVNDQLVLPNIERTSDTVIDMRQQILEIIKDALGNTSREDLSLYKRSIMWKSFFMFKNWIPRMFDVRFGSLKYSPGTNKYEYGRMRMLVNGVRNMGLSSISALTKLMRNNAEPLVEIAKAEYKKKREAFVEELQELEMTEAEFVDMYIKGIRSEMKELMLAASLMAILISMRVMAPDEDENPEMKGMYRWALRGLDKLTDELTFMYTPTSFTSILNGSVFPAVGILVEFEKFFTSVVKKLFWTVVGNEEEANQEKILKHIARALPITKELIQYLAIFNDDMAKEYGIRMNNNYGSVR